MLTMPEGAWRSSRTARRAPVALVSSMALCLTISLGGCGDTDPATAPAHERADLLALRTIISNVVDPSSAGTAQASAIESGVVYVSLPLGTIPDGQSAMLRNARSGALATTSMIDGGFDPIAIQAQEGDTIRLTVQLQSSSTETSTVVVVPGRKRPVVVRTDPPPKKRDVSLNASIVIVFSEPIDPATVNPGSIALRRTDGGVPGTVALMPGNPLVAEFRPAAPLDPETNYDLTVTQDIQDLDGETLEATVQSSFTTGAQVLGTLQITAGSPDIYSDPDGYVVRVERGGFTASAFVRSAGLVMLGVPAGTSVVSLLGVSSACSVDVDSGGPSRQVEVLPGAVVPIHFAVTCTPSVTQLAFVRAGRIYRVNEDGSGLVQLTNGPNDADPAWSPDGKRIAFARSTSGTSRPDIYLMDADGANLTRRTSGGGAYPAWSPDGRQVAFTRVQAGSNEVLVISADDGDGGLVLPVTNGAGFEGHPAWSPNGERLAFVSDRIAYDFTYDIFLTTLDGSRVTQSTNGFGFNGSLIEYWQPTWSPDGSRLAVTSCQIAFVTCQASSIVVMDADGTNASTLTTSQGFGRPAWSPDGQRVAYASADSIFWIGADGGGQRGLIVGNAHSPSWRR